MTDAQDGSGGDEGHEQDASEDGHEYLDRLFSRDQVWSVVIGFGITNILAHVLAIAHPGIPVGTHDDWAIAWAVLTPLLVVGGIAWPTFEKRYASVLPWMDAGGGS